MKGNNITIKELAGKLGVSVSTVSKALNDSFEISEKTKKRVQDLAKKYNYAPNYHAKNLKSKKSYFVGVIIPDMRAPFFNRVLRGLERECSRNGYNIITCFSNDSYEREKEIVQMLSRGMVDGIVMSLTKETQLLGKYDHIQESLSFDLPVVLFDRVCDEVECDKVLVNDFESTYDATRYLLASGYKNVLFISSLKDTSVGKERCSGYLQAMKERVDASEQILEVEGRQEFSKRLKEILKTQPIDAILTSSEFSGISALNIARSLNIKVPQELAIIGFTNGLLSMNSSPPMTTISQHGKKMGKIVAKKVIKRLNNKDVDLTTTIIPTTLIKRGTTRN